MENAWIAIKTIVLFRLMEWREWRNWRKKRRDERKNAAIYRWFFDDSTGE